VNAGGNSQQFRQRGERKGTESTDDQQQDDSSYVRKQPEDNAKRERHSNIVRMISRRLVHSWALTGVRRVGLDHPIGRVGVPCMAKRAC
jgi:hypothetical protein